MRRWVTIGAVLVAAAVAWMLFRGPQGASKPASATTTADQAPKSASINRADAPPRAAVIVKPKSDVAAAKRRVSKQEREALRRRIVNGLAARDAAPEKPSSSAPAIDNPTEDEAADRQPGEGIKDRTGGELKKFSAAINDDFIPLAQECYEQALEVDPSLRGMLDMNFGIIADEDIGGLVDTVELGGENELNNPQMTECVRETMLSTIFPSPDESGTRGIRLTISFEPEQPK